MVTSAVHDDVWIPTVCNMCFNGCHILAHRQDGVVMKIEGNPRSSVGGGRVCAKGASGPMLLYDPHRLTKPVVRTNPEKGVGIDPKWKEISWDEAFTILADRLKSIQGNPGKLVTYGTVSNLVGSVMAGFFFGGAFGSPNGCGSDICGAAVHSVSNILTGHLNAQPDYINCKYLIQFGVQAGTATRHGYVMIARRLADARVKNGMKLVVVDPRMSASAEKADDWLPIRPGTDAALALAMGNVLVNELGIYDAEYLKKFTNAPYLVDPRTGQFVRDEKTRHPHVWDTVDQVPRLFNEAAVKDPALSGSYTVHGVTCQPAFQLLKEHLKSYTPERAEEITTIPAARIRRIAAEFGQAACIGSKIVLDGVEMPYRPAVADAFSGITRHKHAYLSCMSVFLLNVLVGSANVPGGLIGYDPVSLGYPETGKLAWRPGVWEEDGLIESLLMTPPFFASPYRAIREAIQDNGELQLLGIQPLNEFDGHFTRYTQMEPEKYKRKVKGEVLSVYGANLLKQWGNQAKDIEFLKSFDFVFGFDIYLNDSSYFYDLVIPEACYLERLEPFPNQFLNHHTINGMDVSWSMAVRQPVVAPRDGALSTGEIFLELADRLGITPVWNSVLTFFYSLSPEYALDPMKKYTWEEVCDRVYQSTFGQDKGLAWFKENGVLTWPKRLEEVYVFPFMKARIPVYFEFMLEAKEKVGQVTKEKGIPWELDDYQPMPDWKPCDEYEVQKPGYDLFPVYYTPAFHTDSWTVENPWLDEVSSHDPYTYFIEINRTTAENKGLKDGDRVRLESTHGYVCEGSIRVTEGMHPECLGVAGGHMGAKSGYLPIARGKGVPIANLYPSEPGRLCHISAAYDQCARVRISKID